MKKKLLLGVLTVCMSLFAMAAFACGSSHECTFESTWTHDAEYHWHKCEDSTCDLISGKAAHSFVDGVCECGYEDPTYNPEPTPPTPPVHECTFESTWTHDTEYHWHKCEDSTCDLISGKAAHSFVNGICECGYEDPTYNPEPTPPVHECTFKSSWTYDTEYHWHKCEDSTCNKTSVKQSHSFVNGICKCGYEDPTYNPEPTPPVHECTFKSSWTYDTEYHWHKCEDSTCGLISGKAAHSFVNGVCECGYEDPTYNPEPTPPVHECTFESEWTHDTEYHWHKCEDSTCDLISGKAAHSFVNGVCECGYEVAAQIIGFNTQEQIVVVTGTKVVLEQPTVKDQFNNPLTVFFDVIDSKGGAVTTYMDGKQEYFYATDRSYVITYAVYSYDKVVTTKTTKVLVAGNQTVTVKYDKVVETGSTVTINAESGLYDAVFSYEVKDPSGQSVTVTGNSFVPETTGFYQIKVSATANGKDAEKQYTVFARTPAKEGEVEAFNAEWEDLREVNGYSLNGWEITSTAENGLKNYKGENDCFATYSLAAGANEIAFYLDAFGSHDSYKAFAEQGYDKVTFRVYVAGDNNHAIYYDTDEKVGGTFSIKITDLIPNSWNTVSINLAHNYSECLARSFLSGFVLWEEQAVDFLRIKNSNTAEECTIYIDDIFVTKSAIPEQNESATTEFRVGNTYNLTQLVVNGENFTYLIKNNTAKEEYVKIETPTQYKFLTNGDYTLKVIPSEQKYRGEKEISFTVSDDITVKTPWSKLKMTGESITVSFADIGAVLKNGITEINTTITGVWFHDDYSLDIDSSSVTITKAGYYKVYLEATYGNGYKSCKVLDLDIYTDETEFTMTDAEDYIVTRYWTYGTITKESGTYEIGGENYKAFKMNGTAGGTIMFRPMFSKAYYESLSEEYDASVTFSTYYSGSKIAYSKMMPNKADANNCNTWNEKEIDLAWFIENYETIVSSFAEVYENVKNGGNPVIAFGNLFDSGTGENAKYKSYIYAVRFNNTNNCDIYLLDMKIKPMLVDDTEYLIDVSKLESKSSYELKNSFGEKGMKIVNSYDAASLTWQLTDQRGNVLNSNVIDLTQNNNLRMWSVKIFNGKDQVYSGTVDFYDSEATFVWDDDESGVGTWTLFEGRPDMKATNKKGEAVTLDRNGTTVNVLKYDNTKYSSEMYFGVTPVHTKSYYELFKDKEVTISFSVYFDVDEGYAGFNQFLVFGIGQKNTEEYIRGWFDLSVKLSDLLKTWTGANPDGSSTCTWSTRHNYGFMHLYNAKNYTNNRALYVGNFNVEVK